MADTEPIIELGPWLQTPPGRYLLAWEQARFDEAVVDAFGFHALQLGLSDIDTLRANRMPHRWLASDIPGALPAPTPLPTPESTFDRPTTRIALLCDFDALPFPNNSLDLVVLPHALELARDPHRSLREVERVLMPEGRVLITGFNPASLWGLRQRAGRARQGLGIDREAALYLPRAGEFIGYWRLRDWLRLLGFELEGGRFGGYRPPFHTQAWLDRLGWMEAAGERWWPVLGAVYFLAAVKRVRGMRLVGMARREARHAHAAPAVVAQSRSPATTASSSSPNARNTLENDS
jgi:SAM-dependent methyltransferase